jgi:hypothetical protein
MTSNVPGTAPTMANTDGIDSIPTEKRTLNIKANVRYLQSKRSNTALLSAR